MKLSFVKINVIFFLIMNSPNGHTKFEKLKSSITKIANFFYLLYVFEFFQKTFYFQKNFRDFHWHQSLLHIHQEFFVQY